MNNALNKNKKDMILFESSTWVKKRREFICLSISIPRHFPCDFHSSFHRDVNPNHRARCHRHGQQNQRPRRGSSPRYHRIRSSSSSLNFTHMLHARYNSRADLDAYTVHPSHVSVVKANAPFCDDTMALDWVAHDLRRDLVPPPGSAVGVRFLKLKDNSSDEVKNEILGENFSPGRAKGFSIGSVAVFAGISELEAVDSNEEWKKYENEIAIDYVVPSREA